THSASIIVPHQRSVLSVTNKSPGRGTSMSGPAFRRLLIVAAVLAAWAAPAAAQAPGSDLVRENERLRTDLGNMRQELEAARRRIAELEQEVARLNQQLAGNDPADSPEKPEDEVSIDESDPAASP